MWVLSESDPSSSDQPGAVWQRLAEAVEWCGARVDVANPATCFRSPPLRPRVMQGSYVAGVLDACTNRHFALGRRVSPRQDLAGGRILVYGPDEELSDGAAELETGGYFDANNCPPWDTWIALTEFSDGGRGRAAHLFSWVPPAFESLVDRGIYVNPEGCISWLEDWESPGHSEIIETLRTAR
jgi:hypothetical protein